MDGLENGEGYVIMQASSASGTVEQYCNGVAGTTVTCTLLAPLGSQLFLSTGPASTSVFVIGWDRLHTTPDVWGYLH